ncbi:alpha-beta hydrolase fold protein [Fadolivirus algeromassiliense]|uniref:Alpha-beta hydrolase fold protein n=1 Tax=Fadolivirus FV1/VV64 TaxID=3070911 RepID=A0A7D3V7Q2_9VIRU|nr:alpha-beta hydrolase fold protein [Fadolivirus algeromassiliense]QKF94256.1 alpha-beta hydrolase fold protein [Fadolivirus FV1/VV64]
MELIFGTLILKEMLHFQFFNKLKNFVEKKKYSSTLSTNVNWYENYILNELSVDELKICIRNVFSYNKPSDKSYYTPIEIENIPRNKMIKWVSYNLYFKSLWQLTPEEIQHASDVLYKIEIKLNIKFYDISNPDIYFLKFGNNKIECSNRPSIICSILELLKDTCYFSMYMFNFDKYKIKNTNIVYFHYHNPNNKQTVIFIHGFGFGIEPYLYYILRLKNKFNLIVLILPNISNMEYARTMKQITYDNMFPEYDTWRKAIKSIIIKHNIDSCSIIAHSFGTIIAALLLKDNWINAKINKKVFIEPVCFIDKSYKIYRYINEPQEGNYGIVSKVFNQFIYKDIYLRYATQRFLYGPEFWIHDYDSLANNTLIIVSEKDQVVPSDEIYNRMKKHNIECIYVNGAYHADMFMTNEFDSVFNHIDDFILKDISEYTVIN